MKIDFQTGVRPIYDPNNEPKTIVVSGVKDDREYITKVGVDQYSTSDALINELFVSIENKTCALDRANLMARFGAAGAFLDGSVGNLKLHFFVWSNGIQ